MDLGNPAILFSSLVIGSVGFLLFMHGKKQANFRCLFTGVAMCVFPYFAVTSLALMWLGAAACLGGLYAWSRYE